MVERRQVTAWISRSIPVVLVALLWAGLWKMWPVLQPREQMPRQKPFAVKLVQADKALELIDDPTLFAFVSDVSFNGPQGMPPGLLPVPGLLESSREELELGGQTLKAGDGEPVAEYSVWSRNKDGFQGAWAYKQVFKPREPEKQIVVEVSGNLAASGYEPASISTNDFSGFPAGWEVLVLLDVDKTGLPAHVLIEKGSGNKDIDDIVCRRIMSGRSDRIEARGGRVKVSYGFE